MKAATIRFRFRQPGTVHMFLNPGFTIITRRLEFSKPAPYKQGYGLHIQPLTAGFVFNTDEVFI